MIEKLKRTIDDVIDLVELDSKIVNVNIKEFNTERGNNNTIDNYYLGTTKSFVKKILETFKKTLDYKNQIDLTLMSYKYDKDKNVYKFEIVEFKNDFVKYNKKTTIEIIEGGK